MTNTETLPSGTPAPPFFRRDNHLMWGGLLFCFILMLYASSCGFMQWRGTVGAKALEQSTDTLSAFINGADTTASLNQKKMDAIRTENAIICLKKKHYMHIAKEYYANYFGASVVIMISSICGAIVVFLVAYNGWNKTSNLIRTLFIVFFFSATFWGLFPTVFLQEKNYTENFTRYVELDKLHLEIFNFLATGGKLNIEGAPVNSDTMLTIFNKRILEQCNFVIGIDASSIKSMNDFAKNLPGAGPPGN